MPLTELQRAVCRLIAQHRIASGESYVAGGVALNELIAASRISRDVDLFRDTDAALEEAWQADRRLLEGHAFSVRVLRERRSFVEAEVGREGEAIVMEWARDSAYRFFPLVQHETFGLVLHPFDLATNKVLALVGRVEVRDWVDVVHCDEYVQPLGYLAWAACGKDPGFSPEGILEQAARSARYSRDEVLELAFEGEPPDPARLSRRWHTMLDEARAVVRALPADQVGLCVLSRAGDLYRGDAIAMRSAVGRAQLVFHPGRLRGAFPRVLDR